MNKFKHLHFKLLKCRTQQPQNPQCIKGHLPVPKEKQNKDILKLVPASSLTDLSQGLLHVNKIIKHVI